MEDIELVQNKPDPLLIVNYCQIRKVKPGSKEAQARGIVSLESLPSSNNVYKERETERTFVWRQARPDRSKERTVSMEEMGAGVGNPFLSSNSNPKILPWRGVRQDPQTA